MTINVEVQGLAPANAALKRLPDFAKGEAQRVMNTSAFQVAAGAKARAKRRTGRLIGAIDWQARPRSVQAVVGVFPSAYYWKFLEYGTVRMPAQPMFKPAALSIEADHHSRLERALEQAADRMAASAVGGRFL